MKRVLKWIGILAGVLVLLIAASVAVAYALSSRAMSKTYAVTPEPLSVPSMP